MYITEAKPEHIPEILRVLNAARIFMCRNGNPIQWAEGYPSKAMIEEDIRLGVGYVILETEQSGQPSGYFVLMDGPDPTYSEIYDGAWSYDKPYGVIHRLASDGSLRGIASAVFDFAASRYLYLRIDTHRDNAVLQQILKQHLFAYCGIIYLANGSPRLAFDKLLSP